jgi:hypothetical protein
MAERGAVASRCLVGPVILVAAFAVERQPEQLP